MSETQAQATKSKLNGVRSETEWVRIQELLEGGASVADVVDSYGIPYHTIYQRIKRGDWAAPAQLKARVELILKHPLPRDRGYPVILEKSPLNDRVKSFLVDRGYLVESLPAKDFWEFVEHSAPVTRKRRGKRPVNARSLEPGTGNGVRGTRFEIQTPDSLANRKQNSTTSVVSNESGFHDISYQNDLRKDIDNFTRVAINQIRKFPVVPRSIGDVEKVFNMRMRLLGMISDKSDSAPIINIAFVRGSQNAVRIRTAKGKEVIEIEENADEATLP